MEASLNRLDTSKDFVETFKAGKAAARQGDRAQAQGLFRRAIEVDPYHEGVWLWLASVIDSDADRRVCFENVLELNPSNPTARRQLLLLEEKAAAAALAAEAVRLHRAPRYRWPLRLFAALLGVATGVGGASVLGFI